MLSSLLVHSRATMCISVLLCAAVVRAQMPPSTAVSELQAQGIPQSEAVVITEQLRSELLATGGFTLFERSQMAEVLKEQGFQQTGCVNDECAVTMGQLLGVRYMMVGTLGRAGSYVLLTARVLDVKTGAVVVHKTIRTKGSINEMIEHGVRDAAEAITEEFHAAIQFKPSVSQQAEAEEEPQHEEPRRSRRAREKDESEPEPAIEEHRTAESEAEPGEEPVVTESESEEVSEEAAEDSGDESDSGMGTGGKVALVVGISTVVVGGGVLVIVLAAGSDDTEPEGPDDNVRMYLP